MSTPFRLDCRLERLLAVKLFYRLAAREALRRVALPAEFDIVVWEPARDGLPPSEIRDLANLVWMIFDRLGIFANRNCGVIMIRHHGKLVHRSLVTPRWLRFADMAADDLQIGATWTAPVERGKGLAAVAVAAVHAHWAGRFGAVWYIVDESNPASVTVIEKCGYRLWGKGIRTAPLGFSPLGRFVVIDRFSGD